MRRFLIVLFSVYAALMLRVDAQNEASKWYFGNQCVLDFSTSPPTFTATSSMTLGAPAVSSIADASGNIMFYSNGLSIWNQQHQIMANGGGITGAGGGNNSIIIKRPGIN